MGLLLVGVGADRRLLPMPSLALVGRAPACFLRVDHPACPAHWLEIRWRGGAWAWRALAAPERTRGSGAFLTEGWRALELTPERGTRVALDADAFVEIVDASPPEPFAWDLVAGRALTGEALEQVAERRGSDLLPIAAEGDPAARLADGAVWVHVGAGEPRALRAHVPAPLPDTLATRLDLARGDVVVDADLARATATFHQGATEVSVTGQAVRVLVAYALARAADTAGAPAQAGLPSTAGWRTAAEVWSDWVALGGNAATPHDAVAWERTRLRQLLHRARVGSVQALFEQRKPGAYVQIRLGACVRELVLRPG